jgi:hypothetical protein
MPRRRDRRALHRLDVSRARIARRVHVHLDRALEQPSGGFEHTTRQARVILLVRDITHARQADGHADGAISDGDEVFGELIVWPEAGDPTTLGSFTNRSRARASKSSVRFVAGRTLPRSTRTGRLWRCHRARCRARRTRQTQSTCARPLPGAQSGDDRAGSAAGHGPRTRPGSGPGRSCRRATARTPPRTPGGPRGCPASLLSVYGRLTMPNSSGQCLREAAPIPSIVSVRFRYVAGFHRMGV